MKKENLIERAKRWDRESSNMKLMGYPRNGQNEIAKISVAIIQLLCEKENMTTFKAKCALKMATDIIDEETKNDAIS